MAVSTLEDFWSAEVATYNSLKTKLTALVTALQSRLGDAKGSVANAQAALATAQAGLAAAKAALAAETNVGDIPADAREVRKQQALVNAALGDIARWSEAAYDLQLEVDSSNQALTLVSSKYAEAQAALDAANARKAQREAWKTAATAAPLSTLTGTSGDAHTAKSGTDFSNAHDKLKTFFTNELVALLDERHAIEKDRADKIINGLEQTISQYGTKFPVGASAETVAAWRAITDLAFDALGDFVKLGKARYDAAVAAITAINTAPKLCTDAEKAELASGSFSSDGITAAASTATTDRDTAFQTLTDAQAAYEIAVFAQLKDDPDATVSASSTARDNAITDLHNKDATYNTPAVVGDPSSSPRGKVEKWEDALPDSAFQTITSFYVASDALDDLINQGNLIDALTTAETNLAQSLQAAAQAERVAYLHQTVLAVQTKRVDRVKQVRRDRLFSLVRGDI